MITNANAIAYNPILDTDSYKASHWLQYPANTENVFSYIEARGGKYPTTMFFGLQMYLKAYLSIPITSDMIDEAEAVWTTHGEPFNRAGWEYILNTHKGLMPLRIRAVPEGTVLGVSNVLVTVEATDPECNWVTSYVETALLRAVWYPTTVATNSLASRTIIRSFLEETGDVAGLPFKLHDFGARGVSSFESAGIGGLAHLATGAMGTDTITAVLYARKYYGETGMPAYSIPAAEHSTITTFGRAGEFDAYRNMLKLFAREGSMLAVVSDSYDIDNAVGNGWCGELLQEVKDSKALVIIRPDSGDPVEVVTRIVQLIDSKVGSVVNAKGYKVLNVFRVIQGDGITTETIRVILESLKSNGYSADNIAFGQGGALLQQVNRDTCKFAMKASAIKIDGKWLDVFKDPVTDTGKRSKKGRITLYRNTNTGQYFTGRVLEDGATLEAGIEDAMVTVFENGVLLKEWTLEEIRARANS